MKNTLNGVPVQAHLFEYTTSFALDPECESTGILSYLILR